MVTGKGLGIFSLFLKADTNGRDAYSEMRSEFRTPISYAGIRGAAFDALLLPGGRAPGMRPYLESALLQSIVADFFEREKPVGAICHGAVLAARSRGKQGKSVLYGRKTTGLTKKMELAACVLTRLYLGDYYRTYPITVEDEARAALAAPNDFVTGPIPFRRDSPTSLDSGFTVRDANYLSARRPGDAHRFASDLAAMLTRR
jgi:protease I